MKSPSLCFSPHGRGLLEKGLNGITKTPDPLGGRLKWTDLVWVSPNYNHSSYNHILKSDQKVQIFSEISETHLPRKWGWGGRGRGDGLTRESDFRRLSGLNN